MENKKKGMSIGTLFFVFIVLFLTFAFCFMYYKITFQFNSLVAQRNLMLETLIGIETKISMALESEGIIPEQEQPAETTQTSELLTPEELNSIIAKRSAIHIEDIEEANDGNYIITAYSLADEPRVITDDEKTTLKNGGEIEFRNRKWKIDQDQTITSVEGTSTYVLVSDDLRYFLNDRGTTILEFIAGAKSELCEFAGDAFKFKVSKDILIGINEGFKIDDNGNITATSFGEIDNNFQSASFDRLKSASKAHDCVVTMYNNEVKALACFIGN